MIVKRSKNIHPQKLFEKSIFLSVVCFGQSNGSPLLSTSPSAQSLSSSVVTRGSPR
jgi:hypothetical protein